MDGESYVEDLRLQSSIRGLNLNSDFVPGASDLITALCSLYIERLLVFLFSNIYAEKYC